MSADRIVRLFPSRTRPHLPPHRTTYDPATDSIDCTCEGWKNQRKCWHAATIEAEATHPPLTAPRLLDGMTDNIPTATVAQPTVREEVRCPECGAVTEKMLPVPVLERNGTRRLGTAILCTACEWCEVK